MKTMIKTALALSVALALPAAAQQNAAAGGYPNKSVRLVVPAAQ